MNSLSEQKIPKNYDTEIVKDFIKNYEPSVIHKSSFGSVW